MEKYSVEKQIGKGSFGSVYKVMNLNGQTIALKVIDLVTEFQGREAKKEVNFLKAISNPCIPSLICYYDSFVKENKLYIETEFIDGITLSTFGRKNRRNPKFPPSLTAVLGDLIPGLKYLHGKGILHRDIKPDNIMIERNKSQPKFIDVGLACMMLNHAECNKSCCLGGVGSPYYMSPETLLESISYPESDIWSLGASIYHCAVGRNVFDPKIATIPELRREMKENPVVLIKTKYDKLDNLLEAILKKDYMKRISLNDILNDIIVDYVR